MGADATEITAGSPGGVLEEGGCQEGYHGGVLVVRMLVNCYWLGINKTSPKRCV